MRVDATFRVGTLYDFRRIEHGAAVGDAGEGTKEVVETISGEWEDIIARPTLARGPIVASGNANVTLENVTMRQRHDVRDCFLFCVSMVNDPRLNAAFSVDTCIEIENWRGFALALHKAVNARHRCRRMDFAPCEYGARVRHLVSDAEMHPAFLKEPKYAYQHEARILMVPSNVPITPMLVHAPDAARYLKCEQPGT